jgi:vacuolar-type H+-ATPase subunit I/STV1
LASEKRYPLYEHLVYFWKRKIQLVAIAIIFCLIASILYMALYNPSKYQGKVNFYTASISSKTLTTSELLNNLYESDEVNIRFSVPKASFVVLEVKGDDLEKVTSVTEEITKDYDKRLNESYTDALKLTNDYLEVIKKKDDDYKEIINFYSESAKKEEVAEKREDYYSKYLLAQKAVDKINEKTQKMQTDVFFYEQPKILSSDIGTTKTYMKEVIVGSLILGFVFSIVLLTLMKYIQEARKSSVQK